MKFLEFRFKKDIERNGSYHNVRLERRLIEKVERFKHLR